MTVQYGSLPFQQQIDFFLAKDPVPTERWYDLQREAHDTGFMVAGAMKADLLADLHASLAKIYQAGGTLNDFRKDFDKIAADHGWTNFTGSETEEGIAWRTRVIYETNLRTAYQAGRWQQIQDGKAQRPYLIYKHSHAVITPRAEHLAWDGLIVRVDSDWVKTHYPPNGYGCQCTMFALSERDLTRLGKPLNPHISEWTDPSTGKRYSLNPPDDGTYDWKDPKTGAWHTFPKGIQPFWDYAPGASLASRVRTQIERKIEGLPKAIGEQLAVLIKANDTGQTALALNRQVNAELFKGVSADPGGTLFGYRVTRKKTLISWVKEWLWGSADKPSDEILLPTDKFIKQAAKYLPKDAVQLYRAHDPNIPDTLLQSWTYDKEIAAQMAEDSNRQLISRVVAPEDILMDIGKLDKSVQAHVLEHQWDEVIVANGIMKQYIQFLRHTQTIKAVQE